MEKFKPTVIAKEFITAASDALVTQNALVFNDGVGSSTILTDDQALNNNYKNSQSISKDVPTSVSGYKNVDTNTIVANVKISNKTLSADVRISTILIYASYNGNNILAATARLNEPELLPAYDTDKGTPVTLEFAVYMQVSNNINAPVQFNEAGLATSSDLRTVDTSAVHKSGDETIDGIKKFLKPINGTAEITIHYLWDDLDLNTLVDNSVYVANNVKVLQSSGKENFIMRVEAGNSKFPVKQTKYSFDTGMTYVRYQNNGSWTNFIKQPTDDSVLVHLFGDETVAGDKTFTGNNKFTQLIDGALRTREATFTDFADVAKNMKVYAGNWIVDRDNIANVPEGVGTSYIVIVVPGTWGRNGTIYIFDYTSNSFFYTNVDGAIKGWRKVASDDFVVHNTGNETIAGDKTFTGKIISTSSISTTADNSMINGGGSAQSLAMVKKSGDTPFIAIGKSITGQAFKIKQSDQDIVIPNANFTDIFSVDTSGNVKAGVGQYLVPLDKNVAHNSGNESLDGIKTFLKKIQGSITNADVADVRTNSISDNQDISKITTSGYYAGRNVNNVQGIPSANFNGKYFDLTVWVTGSNGFMFIVDDSDHMYFRKRQNSVWLDYKPMPLDATKLPRNDRQETIHETWKFEKDIDGTANYSKQPVLFDIADGTDLNNIKTSGSYSCGTNRVGNAPINNWFSLVVVQNGSFNGVQTLTDTNNGEVYTRTWNNSGNWFSPWEKLSSDSKVVHNSGDETIKGNKKFESKIDGVVENSMYSAQTRLQIVAENYNVDGLTSPGLYGGTNGHLVGLPEYPIWGCLEVMNTPEGDVIQRFNVTNGIDASVLQRVKNNSGWKDWKKVI